MTKYESIQFIGFAAIAALVIIGLLAVFAAVTGDLVMIFTTLSGVVCAFTSICAVDSALVECRRVYVRRIRR